MKRFGIWPVLAVVPALLGTPAITRAQEGTISATASASDCERASADALSKLVEGHGGILFEKVWRDHLHLDGRREKREATQETALLFGALIPPGALRTYGDSSGTCIAGIKMTEEEFKRAQERWLEHQEKKLRVSNKTGSSPSAQSKSLVRAIPQCGRLNQLIATQ